MKKLITLLVTIAMIGVMLTGCGGSGKEVTADPAKLAEDLSKTASGDTLSSISEDILASTYLVDTSKIDSCAAYVIVIFSCINDHNLFPSPCFV